MSTFVNNDVDSGATIFASDHNEQGARIAAVVNGGLDDSNINGSAAIATSKLADDAGVTTAKLADSAVTPAKLLAGTGSSWATTDYSGTATVVGWSATTVKQIRYIQAGKLVTMFLYITGTSNSTLTTVSLPVAPRTTLTFYDGIYGLAQDNTSFKTAAPRYTIDNSGSTATVVSFFPDVSGSSWTASGTKSIRAMIAYEAA